MKKKIIIFFLLSTFWGYAQITIRGTVYNQKGDALYNTNIIASPIGKEGKFSYSTTTEDGSFELKLTKNASYKITISHIGFITLKENIFTLEKDVLKSFILKEDPNELEEVIITYKEPIVVKKDTTTYRTDAFTNGKERKLRQVLKKLPGVEVDRKGNVTVKGKKVTTVLVENKKFFTGDTKLAVNNIPADVIAEIQVIEDYHESSLLKGLETSEEVALNINLKEDKKKFAFGNIEVGGGIKDRYVVHPTLFKYSPKVNYNFIGDFNNTNDKSFTLKEYINYEGGFDVNSFSSIYKSPIVKLLRDKDFTTSKHLFGGFNVQWNQNEKNDWSTFVIALSDKSSSRVEQSQNYLIDNIFENRITLGKQKQNILLGKIQLKAKPNKNTRLKFETKIDFSSANSDEINNSVLSTNSLDFLTEEKVKQFSVKTDLKIEKKFSIFHTSQAKFGLKAIKSEDNIAWNSDQNIFSNSLPIINTDNYDVLQNSKNKLFEFNTSLKHFWIINPKNHLYLKISNQILLDDYDNYSQQVLTSRVNDFQGFNNSFSNNKIISDLDVEYKRLIGEAFLTLKLKYQNYNRVNKQQDAIYTRYQNFILPEVNFQWDIDRKRKLTFNYAITNNFPDTKELAINNSLRSFNSIYLGNINLKESFYHTFRLNFRKYQNYGWSFYPRISYRLKNNTVQNTFQSNTIYNSLSPININEPVKELTSSIRVVYNYKYWKALLFTEYRNMNYSTLLNNLEVNATNNNILSRIGFRSVYINGPNVDFSLSQSYNDNTNSFFNSTSDRTNVDFTIDYEKGDWQFKGEFLYNYFKNRVSKTSNSFNEINSSIFYQKEDSSWGFEIKAKNLLNNTNKINSNLSNVLFNETKTFVFPRTIMFKVIYKI
ncbi:MULTISPECIES: TonB-dependent receptor [Tenacibaculum]|uniref:TonB-dependent receptor n=1 Tax=Tenacibaculum TaxID=104267 RepID=UPI001F0A9981|nr:MULTISPECIES: TonB-dependent receptor [Tenacibaculum]MCH3881565.1 TonB-dependent receptor family protein [Tenacibaculum aquimarinum]MDO6598840.1 TonB-dependent receptor [Tenacibaculum sp. 1_MG-2023]